MDIMTEYQAYSQMIDQCDDVDKLKEYQNQKTFLTMRREFWKQRKLFLSSRNPLEKQKALAKLQWIQHFFGSNIPIRSIINQFTAPNGLYGIFISSEAAVGTNCVIFQQVTIGANTLPDSEGAGFPTIGNNVYIGPGAKIIGNVTIGDNVRIEANCCVTTDIPPNSIVSAGTPVITQSDVPLCNEYLIPQQYIDRYYDKVIYDYAEHADDPEIVLEKAALSDIDAIMQLYQERIVWFRRKKIPQWGHYLEHHPREEFEKGVKNGEYHVVKKGSEVVAGFTLSDNSENWTDDDPEAWYLSRVVIKPGYKNLGSYISDVAKKLTVSVGKKYLRLECIFENQPLNNAWEKHGFLYIRDVEGTYHCSLREWNNSEDAAP